MELPKKKENENKINCLNEYIKYNENLTVFEGSTGRLKVIGHLRKFEKTSTIWRSNVITTLCKYEC